MNQGKGAKIQDLLDLSLKFVSRIQSAKGK